MVRLVRQMPYHFLELCATPEHFSAVLGHGAASREKGRACTGTCTCVIRSTYSVYTYVETSPPAVADAKVGAGVAAPLLKVLCRP